MGVYLIRVSWSIQHGVYGGQTNWTAIDRKYLLHSRMYQINDKSMLSQCPEKDDTLSNVSGHLLIDESNKPGSEPGRMQRTAHKAYDLWKVLNLFSPLFCIFMAT